MAHRTDCSPLVDLNDDELVARFQDGDGDALNVLLERYRRFARAKARTPLASANGTATTCVEPR